MSSFSCDHFHDYENKLLPNDVISHRSIVKDQKYLERGIKVEMARKDVQVKRKAQSNASLSLHRSPRASHTKLDAKSSHGLRFRCSTYPRKANNIIFPTELVPHKKSFGFNGNHSNKFMSRVRPVLQNHFLFY